MRLFEAIIDANHRAVAGDKEAGVRVAEFGSELPVIALTCVDPRLNALFPNVLGLPGDQFIWLRNAGNIITSPISSTMRSLALACAVKGGKEIAVIGHTDCQVRKTTTVQLLEKLKELGIERHMLPENLNEFFGTFASESQNVIKACGFVRSSPIIGPQVPVHGLMVDIETGKLEWIVNGYEGLGAAVNRWNQAVATAENSLDSLKSSLVNLQLGEMKFPETKIGETVTKAGDWLGRKVESLRVDESNVPHVVQNALNMAGELSEMAGKLNPPPLPSKPEPPRKLPLPPPMKPRLTMRRK